MGNLLPVSVCPICDLDTDDDDDSVGHEFSHELKFAVYREGANGVSFRSSWVRVRARVRANPNPSSKSASEDTCRPTLLVISGRGRSRAGIFSRKQLLVSGIEAATAFNTVKEGRKRGLNVVLMDHYSQQDPNSQIDTMDAFESSLEAIFASDQEQDGSSWHSSSHAFDSSRGPVFVLAHSASGGKLVVSLLEGKARRHLLPRIGGIVFTDSTHNIQWCSGVQRVWNLLESQKCLYIRSNEVRSSSSWRDGDETRRAGEEVNVDTFWEHRFGTIRTVWAGTADHSLMNMKSVGIIWSHFDDLIAAAAEEGSNVN